MALITKSFASGAGIKLEIYSNPFSILGPSDRPIDVGFFYDDFEGSASNITHCELRSQEYHGWCTNVGGDKDVSTSLRGGREQKVDFSQ